MDPENIIKENKNIPLFVFDMSGLIDKTLQKSCLFHENEVYGHGIVSALVVMTKSKRDLDFLDEDQATELVQKFSKEKEGQKCCTIRH